MAELDGCLKEQAVQAAAIALGKDDSWFAWDDPTGPRPGMPITAARIAVEAAWDLLGLDYLDHKERDRLRQHVLDLRAMHAEEERAVWARVAALEQAARDFLEQAAGGAVHGSSWDEFERTAERLRAAVDGIDRGEVGP
jgi:hypothetical protein